MLARAVMPVVFVLGETISLGTRNRYGGRNSYISGYAGIVLKVPQ